MKKFFLTILFALVLLPVTMQAQTTKYRDFIEIAFTPNHANWCYAIDDTVEMQVSVQQYNVILPEAEITYSWGMEMSEPDEEKTVKTDKQGLATLRLKGSHVPGFKTISATAQVDGKSYTNYLTVGFAPDKIQPTVPMPDDFTEFWTNCLTTARKTPLEPLFTLQPDLCTPASDVYMVRYQVNRANSYFYGMMRLPKGVDPYRAADKTYPALLEVPGAGVRSYKGALEDYTKAGIITLQVGIHGIPVNLPEQVYTDLYKGALSYYKETGLDNRDTYYYNRVYVGCVRAIDLLCSMPCVDTTRIAVCGGSQGGLLSLVVAALSPKIACAAVAYPGMCEMAGSQRGRIDGGPYLFTNGKNASNREEKMQVVSYYDAVNFARLVKVPVLFIQGYNDRTCPPTTTLSAYNVIPSEKELLLPLNCAHWLYDDIKAQRTNWLIQHLQP